MSEPSSEQIPGFKRPAEATSSRQTAQLSPTQNSAPRNREQDRSYFKPQSLGLIYEAATASEAPLDCHP